MHAISTNDDRLNDALQELERAIEAENALPPPNPYLAAFFNALFSSGLIMATLYSLYALYQGIDLYPIPDPNRGQALTLALARESAASMLTAILLMAGVLIISAFNIKRRIVEDLCTDDQHQQAFYVFDDNQPKAPADLRNAAHALRLSWPPGVSEPRLVLTFLGEESWMGTPVRVRWSLVVPNPLETTMLPPRLHQRTYSLGQL